MIRREPGGLVCRTVREGQHDTIDAPKILVHEYVALDMRRVVEAMNRLEPVKRFLTIVAGLESADDVGPV